MVLSQVMDYIEGDDTIWERGPMERLAAEGDMAAFVHDGFWHCMDTLRDKPAARRIVGIGQGSMEDLVVNATFWKEKKVLT